MVYIETTQDREFELIQKPFKKLIFFFKVTFRKTTHLTELFLEHSQQSRFFSTTQYQRNNKEQHQRSKMYVTKLENN